MQCRESLEGRLDYANEIIDNIMDSADDPLGVSCEQDIVKLVYVQ